MSRRRLDDDTASESVSGAAFTHDPVRLEALCELWRSAERDLWVTLEGTSMTPTILPGSRVRLTCGPFEPASKDVIAFRRDSRLIIHRVKHCDANGYVICQGDANSLEDAPVPFKDVVGLVAEFRPPNITARAQRVAARLIRGVRSVPRRFANHSKKSSNSFTPALVALARSGATGQPVPDGATLQLTNNSWDSLLAMAKVHGLLPMVAAGATISDIPLPTGIAYSAQRSAIVTLLKADRAWEQIRAIREALDDEQIKMLVLKGILLATRHYPAPELRQFGDIDLLVAEKHRDAAAAILLNLGYRCTDDMDTDGKEWRLRNHFHWTFMREGSFPVELHWNLTFSFPSRPADMEALWNRAQIVHTQAGDLLTLGNEDEVIALAAHMTSHCFKLPMRCHADFAAILSRFTSEQWDILWLQAAELGQERDLRAVLGTGNKLGFLDLPCVTDGWNEIDLEFLARYAVECLSITTPERWLDVRNAPTHREALTRLFRVAFPRYGHLCTPNASESSPTRDYATAWYQRTTRIIGSMRDLSQFAADCRRTNRVHRMFGDRRRR